MSTTQAPAASLYPDRSTTLIVAGIFEILLGCLCALLAAMMIAITLLGPMAQPPQGHAMNPAALVQVTVFYGLLAVAFIWVGIGLVRARRWAWTLTIVCSWMWLIIGAVSFVAFICFMGGGTWAAVAEQGKMQPELAKTMQIMMTAVMACIYLLLPAAFLVLCHHESVRATCRRRDPQISWTDRCPMPVLALSLMLAFSVMSMSSLGAYRWTMPLLGVFITGAAGAVVILLIALALAYLAWGTYRLQRIAWWGTLLIGIVGTVNMVVTFSRTDLIQMYEKMGMPADQIELIRKMGMVEMMSRWGPWLGLAGGVGWLGYLLFLRRYFVHRGATPIVTS
ncbi:MAG TPA: hypothetical protein VMR25_21020 [Planctomycetaceae bacterium]|jgi:hypothetical protein|nr:hypothetical protein [Planctomycetaceae bacterium]